ncbi:tRNA glutamyl-Q(34) synthetase GluQRS [Trichloromonas sp.]|uniref:tRNA glutamyl-Q(34) synthetase GluQRS n=1 Tax=Trichloromonas sp. TaxID=3069249 RepID=UPI003D814441
MSAESIVPIGRFAPSPTGPLHFGSLLAAVGSYCLARQGGGRWLLRIEDLDRPREVAGAADEIMRTLEALALFWDGEVVWQSRRSERYAEILARLDGMGLVFGCTCSRKEILASAPHAGEEGPIYPGTCRSGLAPGRRARAWRLRVPSSQVCLTDGVFGPQSQCLADEVGDFVLRRADGLFAYQLAVVVDDADAGVTQVVRGQDLLTSTPRQVYLQECLRFPHPRYIHLPLALAAEGKKISKRHGAVAVGRDSGEQLWQALRFLGQAVPVTLRGAPPAEVLDWGVRYFELARVPKDPRVPEPLKKSAPGG